MISSETGKKISMAGCGITGLGCFILIAIPAVILILGILFSGGNS